MEEQFPRPIWSAVMIFGNRKRNEENQALQDLAWAQRLSVLADLEYLTSALDISERWSELAKEKGGPSVGPQATTITQAVLPQVQRLGATRCRELLQTAESLLDEERFDRARETAEQARHVFDRSRLWKEPMLACNVQLLDAINEIRLKRTAQPLARRAIRSARQILESTQSALLMDEVDSYLGIAAAEVTAAADADIEASLAELLNDPRVASFGAQKRAAQLVAEKELAVATLAREAELRSMREYAKQEALSAQIRAQMDAELEIARYEANYGRMSPTEKGRLRRNARGK